MKKILSLLVIVSLAGCIGCSKSGRKYGHSNKERVYNNIETDTAAIKMEEEGGIYKIPIEINGVTMHFIFDTGASIISMSETEALFLYKQGTLKERDFLGKVDFTDAIGNISEGTIINLKSVKIGKRTLYNVKASVVPNNQAPLLLGQSALAQFGKVSIDYTNHEISFE